MEQNEWPNGYTTQCVVMHASQKQIQPPSAPRESWLMSCFYTAHMHWDKTTCFSLIGILVVWTSLILQPTCLPLHAITEPVKPHRQCQKKCARRATGHSHELSSATVSTCIHSVKRIACATGNIDVHNKLMLMSVHTVCILSQQSDASEPAAFSSSLKWNVHNVGTRSTFGQLYNIYNIIYIIQYNII